MKVIIQDSGEPSVGIGSINVEVVVNLEIKDFNDDREEMRTRFIDFFEGEFDMIGHVSCLFDDEKFDGETDEIVRI